jgi:hypothetical protein
MMQATPIVASGADCFVSDGEQTSDPAQHESRPDRGRVAAFEEDLAQPDASERLDLGSGYRRQRSSSPETCSGRDLRCQSRRAAESASYLAARGCYEPCAATDWSCMAMPAARTPSVSTRAPPWAPAAWATLAD